MTTKKDKIDLSKNLEELAKIADWFDNQDDVDIEEGLQKVKEAVGLIKESKTRLQEVENEFEEIKREVEEEIEEEIEGDEGEGVSNEKSTEGKDGEDIDPDNIPF